MKFPEDLSDIDKVVCWELCKSAMAHKNNINHTCFAIYPHVGTSKFVISSLADPSVTEIETIDELLNYVLKDLPDRETFVNNFFYGRGKSELREKLKDK